MWENANNGIVVRPRNMLFAGWIPVCGLAAFWMNLYIIFWNTRSNYEQNYW